MESCIGDYIIKTAYYTSNTGAKKPFIYIAPVNGFSKSFNLDKAYDDIFIALKEAFKKKSYFYFKNGQEAYKIPINDIIYFESFGRKIKLIGANNSFLFYGRQIDVANSLSEFRFICPHRSYLINYDHAVCFNSDSIIMSNQDRVPVSRLRSKTIKDIQSRFEK